MARIRLVAALAVVLLISFLVACGDDDDGEAATGDDAAETSEASGDDEVERDDEAEDDGGDHGDAFATMAQHAHPEPTVTNVQRLAELGKPEDYEPAAPGTGRRIGAAPGDVGACPDQWVTQAVAEFNGVDQSYVFGKACDPYLYGAANWTTYDDLRAKVSERFSQHCGDRWVTLAVMLVFDRVPQGHDCNIGLYGGGSWSSFPDLLNKVWASYYTAPPPDPSWRILVLVYKNVSFPSTTGPTGAAVANTPFSSTMTAEQVADVRNTVSQMPGIASALSGGRARISAVDVREVDRSISSLSPEGTANVWVGPADVRPELDAYAPEGSYDSVLVVFRNDMPGVPGPKMAGVGPTAFGLAVGPLIGSARERWRDGTNGAGYAMVALPGDSAPLGTTGERGYSVFLHEWLHQVEMTYFNHAPDWRRDFLPNCQWDNPATTDPTPENRIPLHCAEFHGFSSGMTPTPMPPSPYPGTAPFGWDEWYQNFMSGEVAGRSIQAEMWARGGARTLR